MQKLISLIIPIYNERNNITQVYEHITAVLHKLHEHYEYELLFIDDGSTDGSDEIITQLAGHNQRVSCMSFSKNFGKEIALSAGLQEARGEAVIMADGDGQHPFELIPEFVRQWEKGAEVVIGVRQNNEGESWLRRAGGWMFYRLMRLMSSVQVVHNATDYRLLDRAVVNEFNKLTERNRMTRALIDWLGFKRAYISFTAPHRVSGKAQYNFSKLLALAQNSLVAYSFFPLKLAAYLGVIISFCSGCLGLFMVFEKYVDLSENHYDFSWPATLAVFILFLIGVVLMCLGLVALYIGHIKDEVTNRPLYIVRKRVRRTPPQV